MFAKTLQAFSVWENPTCEQLLLYFIRCAAYGLFHFGTFISSVLLLQICMSAYVHIQLWIIYRCRTNWFNEIRLWLQIWRLRDLEIRGDGHDKLWSALGDYEDSWRFTLSADQELWCQLRTDKPTKEKCVCIHTYDWDAVWDLKLQGRRCYVVWEGEKWRSRSADNRRAGMIRREHESVLFFTVADGTAHLLFFLPIL